MPAKLPRVGLWPFTRWPKTGSRASRTPDERLHELDVKDKALSIRERELKVLAIEQVARDVEVSSIERLEVIAIATQRGRALNLPPRRKPEASALEQMAMGMLERKLSEDPSDALEKLIDRRERLEEAADRLSGKAPAAEGDDSFMGMLAKLADSGFGQAIGQSVGQRIVQVQQPTAQTPAAPPSPPALPVVAAPAVSGGVIPVQPEFSQAPHSNAPQSLQVGIALRMLRNMTPAKAAAWVMNNSESNEKLGQVVDMLIGTEPEDIQEFLNVSMQASVTDPDAREWIPLFEYLRSVPEWTLQVHAHLRELVAKDNETEAEQEAS